MPAWPGTLPTAPFFDGLEFSPVDQSISTEMETGPPKRRRRFSAELVVVRVPMLLTGTELAAFRTFYNTSLSGGSATFTFTDPSDGTTATYQFITAPSWRPIMAHATPATRLWRGTLELVAVG